MIAMSALVTRSCFSSAAATLCSFPFVSDTGHENLMQAQNADMQQNNKNYKVSASWMRNQVSNHLDENPSMAGPLIRLAFHDATTYEYGPTYITRGTIVTGGPNGSIRYEVADWSENRGLAKPLRVVESLWSEQQQAGLSFADAVALSGAQAVEHAGGPHIAIRLGRCDIDHADPQLLRRVSYKSSKRSRVERTMPDAGLYSVGLRLYFGRFNLSEREFVALSGIHGLGRHVTLLGMSKACLKDLTRACLEEAPVMAPFVTSLVDRFSNDYFMALLQWYNRQVELELGEVAFIPTDVALVVDDGLRQHVERYARDKDSFERNFLRAFQKILDTTATTRERY